MLPFFLLASQQRQEQQSTPADDSIPKLDSLRNEVQNLYRKRAYKNVVNYVENDLPEVQLENFEDSLNLAKIYYFKFESELKLKDYLKTLNAADKGLELLPNYNMTPDMKQIEAMLYYKRAYAEEGLDFQNRAEKTMLKGVELLSNLEAKKYIHLIIDGYTFLSTLSTYNRNFEDSKYYLRKAQEIYEQKKEDLDGLPEVTVNYLRRNEILLPVKTIYLLTESAKTPEDSLLILSEMAKLDKWEASLSFNKNQSIYYTRSLNAIGDWYLNKQPDSLLTKETIELAEYYINRSIDLKQEKDYHIYYFSFNYKKSRVLTYKDDLEPAYELINELLDSVGTSDWTKNTCFLFAQKGLIEAKMNEKQKSLQSFYQAINALHSGTDSLSTNFDNFSPGKRYIEVDLILGIIDKLKYYYPEDKAVKGQIANLYEAAFDQFENTYVDSRFSKNQNTTLRRIIRGLIASRQSYSPANEASLKHYLASAETIINRLAWKQFYQSRNANNLPVLDSLQQRGLYLRQQLVMAREVKNQKKQDSLSELLVRLSHYSKATYPNLELLSEKEFSLDTLQSQLANNELVIKYYFFEEDFAILSIGNKSIQWTLRDSKNGLSNLIEKYLTAKRNKSYDMATTKKLSELLLPPIDPNVSSLIINPDALLTKLPFELLIKGDEFLIDNYNMRYTSNLGFVFPDIELGVKEQTTVGIYAPQYPKVATEFVVRSQPVYLEGAKEESETISSLFDAQLFSQEGLSKEDFINTASNPELLHLAMHALINAEEPSLSRLLFSDDNSTTDDLYLEEIYGLKLNAGLAVLSACNTGIGGFSANQTMESFQRAFTFAGVPATVASLWEVPDSATKEIMIEFYKNLKKGELKSVALKNAKNRFRNIHKGTKLEQPYYWAGFVLYGTDDPVVAASPTYYWLLIAGALVIGFLIWRRQRHQKLV
jgi:CHAT domain-containing protein